MVRDVAQGILGLGESHCTICIFAKSLTHIKFKQVHRNKCVEQCICILLSEQNPCCAYPLPGYCTSPCKIRDAVSSADPVRIKSRRTAARGTSGNAMHTCCVIPSKSGPNGDANAKYWLQMSAAVTGPCTVGKARRQVGHAFCCGSQSRRQLW